MDEDVQGLRNGRLTSENWRLAFRLIIQQQPPQNNYARLSWNGMVFSPQVALRGRAALVLYVGVRGGGGVKSGMVTRGVGSRLQTDHG